MTNLCVCPPFKKSFTSGETPGPGLWRLYISIHNWWPGPRQTAHYTCNMDSLLVSDACPRLDLTLSHHCVWREWHMCVCESLCVGIWIFVSYDWCSQIYKAVRPHIFRLTFGSYMLMDNLIFFELFLWFFFPQLFYCLTLFGFERLRETEAQWVSCFLCGFLGTNWSGVQVLGCLFGLTLLLSQYQWRFIWQHLVFVKSLVTCTALWIIWLLLLAECLIIQHVIVKMKVWVCL